MKCSVKSCDRPVIQHKECGLCHRCYSYLWHATHQGVRWIMKRHTAVVRYQELLDVANAGSNVVHLKRRKAA